jgi:protocatechuate 3,4-dioxygenase alpha subunit
MSARQTPSQTVGPFFRPALIDAASANLVRDKTRGERMTIEGRVIDGDGAPVTDAMLEIWQANAEGKYDHPDDDQEKLIDPTFHGYGRTCTDERGAFSFRTIKPGSIPGIDGELQAPHINLSIFARGLLKRLVTRIYFPDDPLNATDAVLNAAPAQRRATMIAAWTDATHRALRFDVILQGAQETVFLDI